MALKKPTVTLIFLAILLFSNPTLAFPRNDLRPGGVVVISITPSTNEKPNVTYQSDRVILIRGQQNWLAIVGIPLDAKVGSHKVKVIDSKGTTSYKGFRVRNYKYRTQRLKISNKNKVNPNKKSQNRIQRELVLKKRLETTFTNTNARLNFIKPVAGRDSSRFGLKRVLNKQKRSPHSGMDIAAPTGRSVKATESGTVLYVGDLFFTGKVVYLDHGSGVISLYAHLSKTNVKKGQNIKKGQVIGKVGSTGRVTGPHLHWSVYLNGNTVDPTLFLPHKTK